MMIEQPEADLGTEERKIRVKRSAMKGWKKLFCFSFFLNTSNQLFSGLSLVAMEGGLQVPRCVRAGSTSV